LKDQNQIEIDLQKSNVYLSTNAPYFKKSKWKAISGSVNEIETVKWTVCENIARLLKF
jgi:hypothetical protein